ncbi:hypothetical protein MRB56_08060 [Halomonas cupida]|uniref:hypothetical protein n=1 Tax=Halomonas cupida TaxID=44933 RepID=UPI0039B5B38D
MATHISVHSPAMISCFRPVAFTAHHLLILPGIDGHPVKHLLVREYIGDLREDHTTLRSNHARQDGGYLTGLSYLRQPSPAELLITISDSWLFRVS